jgi:hypothetical protein
MYLFDHGSDLICIYDNTTVVFVLLKEKVLKKIFFIVFRQFAKLNSREMEKIVILIRKFAKFSSREIFLF